MKVCPKITIMSKFTHPLVISNLYYFLLQNTRDILNNVLTGTNFLALVLSTIEVN